MSNETILKFNYPDSLIHEYEHWVVLLRPAQVTVGSLVLASREDARRFPDVSRDGFAELRRVAADLESALQGAFQYDRINYLMLMMVDRQVHYHVIPRYSAPVRVDDREYADDRWPGPPDVTRTIDLPAGALTAIQERVTAAWPR
jgi:diadenosine tetraphosphate (Ap4A) HIT family hydrolase